MKLQDAFYQSPFRSIKHSTYFDVYERIFSPWVNKKVTFVEIGVLGGGSLFMWRKFFGPDARIIGIDLNPLAKKLEDSGFEIFIGNQSDPNFWSDFYRTVGNVDILLDDGGHTYVQQIQTVFSAIGNVTDGGVVVVEDTHTSYMPRFGNRRQSFLRWVFRRIDEINSRFFSSPSSTFSRNVWSIEIFESFVIFKIDSEKACSPRTEVENGATASPGLVEDYRRKDRFSAWHQFPLAGMIPSKRLQKFFRNP